MIMIVIIIIGLVFCQGLSKLHSAFDNLTQPSTLFFLVGLFFVCLSHPVTVEYNTAGAGS